MIDRPAFRLFGRLFEMATGRRPFAGDTTASLIAAILRDVPPSVTDVNAALPAEFARIVRRALAKDPTRRYQTALDVRNELEDLRRETGITVASAAATALHAGGESGIAARAVASSGAVTSAPTSAPIHRGRWLLPAAIVAGMAVLAAGAYLYLRSSSRSPGATSLAVQLAERQVTSNPPEDPVWYASISPDGKFVAYGDFSGIHERLIDTGENRTIPVPPGICFT